MSETVEWDYYDVAYTSQVVTSLEFYWGKRESVACMYLHISICLDRSRSNVHREGSYRSQLLRAGAGLHLPLLVEGSVTWRRIGSG